MLLLLDLIVWLFGLFNRTDTEPEKVSQTKVVAAPSPKAHPARMPANSDSKPHLGGGMPVTLSTPGRVLKLGLDGSQQSEGCRVWFLLIAGAGYATLITWISWKLWPGFRLRFDECLIGGVLGANWLLGVYGLCMGFKTLLIVMVDGVTTLEASADVLAPGQTVELWLQQTGHLRMNNLVVKLQCEEYWYAGNKGRYRNSAMQHEAVLLESGPQVVTRNQPYTQRFFAQIPTPAIRPPVGHRLGWFVRVEGDVKNWPDFQRNFSLFVRGDNADAPR